MSREQQLEQRQLSILQQLKSLSEEVARLTGGSATKQVG